VSIDDDLEAVSKSASSCHIEFIESWQLLANKSVDISTKLNVTGLFAFETACLFTGSQPWVEMTSVIR
jgi:hypothetical protein